MVVAEPDANYERAPMTYEKRRVDLTKQEHQALVVAGVKIHNYLVNGSRMTLDRVRLYMLQHDRYYQAVPGHKPGGFEYHTIRWLMAIVQLMLGENGYPHSDPYSEDEWCESFLAAVRNLEKNKDAIEARAAKRKR